MSDVAIILFASSVGDEYSSPSERYDFRVTRIHEVNKDRKITRAMTFRGKSLHRQQTQETRRQKRDIA